MKYIDNEVMEKINSNIRSIRKKTYADYYDKVWGYSIKVFDKVWIMVGEEITNEIHK